LVESILRARDLSAHYLLRDGTIKAVDRVSFSASASEILGIAGESGCGKSTLIKVLYGLVKPPLVVSEGSVLYNLGNGEIDLLSNASALDQLRWKFASYIPQGSMSVLNPTRRIKKHFIDVIETHSVDLGKSEANEMVQKHIERLGLPQEVLSSYPHQLSGGMRQRVVIALATILKPKIIFADEPTTALDVVVQRGILQLLERVQKELENLIILVTHDMGAHAQITNRMAIMYAGSFVEIASTEDIFGNPIHPYTNFLIKSLPKIGDKIKRSSIGGKPPSLRLPPSGCRFHPRCPFATYECKEEIPLFEEVETNHYVACHMVKKS
jgi:peptide/nickel transport system ATP-binding protein